MSESGRDFVGYGREPPRFRWPGGKRLALSLVVNYEEGSEHSHEVDGIVEGVGEFLPIDIPARDVGNESSYEYGPRVAVWRILDTFKRFKTKATFFATAEALGVNPSAARAIVDEGHEVCDHGLRWTEHYRFSYDQEKEMIEQSVKKINQITGKVPVGFYAREPSVNTIKIVEGMGNFIYESDCYNDDLPYRHGGDGILMLPYTPDANDFHFQSPMHRFANASEFFTYLKDSLDVMRGEARRNPKMMSVGLHCRVIGRPGRVVALRNFLSYVKRFDDVWVATREEIARHWIEKVEPSIRRR
jgi:peptidoglycan/xylan/chitin deacetylase (PgdA/CDA1 family)